MQAAKRQGRHMGRVSTLPQSTADVLNAEGLTTATGLPWPVNGVAKVQRRFTTRLTVAACPTSSPVVTCGNPPQTKGRRWLLASAHSH